MTDIKKLITFGSKFKMCISEQSNYFNTSNLRPGPPPGFRGAEGETLNALVEYFGANFDYYIPDIEGFGTYIPNGTFKGCNDLMQRKEVDVIFACSFYNLHDLEIAQPTQTYYQNPINFITKIPDKAPKFDVLLKTFDLASFIMILISIFLVALVFYLLTNRKDSYVAHLISRIAELALQEPFVKIKMTPQVGVLTTFWMISAQFITFFFMAVILTALTLPNRKPLIDDVYKLLKAVENNEYKVVTFNNTNFLFLLESSPIEAERKIGNIMHKNGWLKTMDSHNILDVLEEDTAVISVPAQRNILIPPSYAYITSKEALRNPLYFSIYISRSFPLKKRFHLIVARMIESGLHERFLGFFTFKQQLTLFKNYRQKIDDSWRSLTLEDLQVPFILLAIGLFISCVVFIWEIITCKINCKQKAATDDMDSNNRNEEM